MPCTLLLWGLNQALFSPMVYHNEGFLFFYPLYTPKWLQCCYTAGSFYLVFFQCWMGKTLYNHKFNHTFYKVFVGGSMWAYLSHYLWIIIAVDVFVRPNKFDFAIAAPITLVGCELMILMSHFVLVIIDDCCFPKRKAKRLVKNI